jgi:phosphoglycerate dehydrogenase-like enzyme
MQQEIQIRSKDIRIPTIATCKETIESLNGQDIEIKAHLVPISTPVQEADPFRQLDAEALWLSLDWYQQAPSPRHWAAWSHQLLDSLPNLKWLHTDSVGLDHLPLAEILQRSIVVTNGKDNFARPMAEWVVLSMLYQTKQLGMAKRLSDQRIWQPLTGARELEGMKALFLGFGSFLRLAAEMLEPFGVEITALVKTRRNQLPRGVTRLVYGNEWYEYLPLSDVVVVGLPLSALTESIVNWRVLSSMPRGSWLVNLARGKVVDEAALIRALDTGHLGGAILDSFVNEPLPPDHPLWGRDNTLVLPHSTYLSPKSKYRAQARLASLAEAYVASDLARHAIDIPDYLGLSRSDFRQSS